MAVQAALTGHVVFSTIHANDCVGVVSRLLDMQIDPFLVASSLSLSISQRLVRMSCKHCSVMVEGREVLRQLRADGVSDEKMAAAGPSHRRAHALQPADRLRQLPPYRLFRPPGGVRDAGNHVRDAQADHFGQS